MLPSRLMKSRERLIPRLRGSSEGGNGSFKTMLLFDKAELTTDPEEREALNREAMEYQRAMALYAKSRQSGTPQN